LVKPTVNMPCPNCNSINYSSIKEHERFIILAAEKDEESYRVIKTHGINVFPVICINCGYVLLFRMPT